MLARPPEAAQVSACLSRLESGLADPAVAVTAVAGTPQEILEAALRSLLEQRGKDALPLLSALADQGSTKESRKLARRALYRLSQSGLKLPPRVSRPMVRRQPERLLRAWLSGIDGTGSRAVWILLEGRYGEWELCSLIVNDQVGILEAAGGAITTKRLDTELEKLRAAQKLPWVELRADAAVALVTETLARTQTAHLPPSEFARWRHLFGSEGATSRTPMIAALLPSEEIRSDSTLLDRSPSLMELPELAGWFVDPGAIQSQALELLQARDSQLVVPDQVKIEREAAIVERVVEGEFTEEGRQRWARRLAEMAWIFHATGREHEAEVAYATSLALEDASVPVRHIPFAESLAKRGLDVAAEVALGRVSANEASRAPGPISRRQ
ncbi:MAG: hypothetical protein ACE5JD_16740 [Candidatus Methylomirabilia bacterium]